MTDYYIKNPVVVEAYQYFGDDFELPTLEGKYTVTEGYWIVTGVKGEKYPVRDDIFKETYHKVGNGTLSDTDRINEYISILEERNIVMWKEIERLQFQIAEGMKEKIFNEIKERKQRV